MKKILIVEDERAYREILCSQLTENGYTVIEAADGKTGLEKAKSEKPDLVLLDVRLPVMDGMSVLSLLRKEETGTKMKVILLTNIEPDDKVIEDVVRDQPSYYFVKSNIRLSNLLEKIRELLSG